jgi:hypothetical protein
MASGKGGTFENSSGGKSANHVSSDGEKITTTTVNDSGTQKSTYDRAEAEQLHKNLGEVLKGTRTK